MRRRALALGLALIVLAPPARASAEITLKLPPPELGALLPLASPALDKPPVPLPAVALPPSPEPLPELPAPRLVSDLAARPVAPLPPPRLLACNPIGTVFGVASELIECGRARYQRGELEEAREAFEKAVQSASDRALTREARYWLGETLLRLNRANEVERVLLLVAQDDPRGEFGYFAAHELGWLALEFGNPTRALGYFDGLLKAGAPPDLVPWARHGRAMALYGLKRYEEARDTWAGLPGQSVPRSVANEATFWLGETLGRLGDYKGAVARLSAFTNSGPQLQIESGLLRLAWWSRAGGQPLEAAKSFRAFLSAYPRSPEAIWGRVGLVLALLDLDDFAAAREEWTRLTAADRSGAVSLATLLAMSRWTTEKVRPEQAGQVNDDLLARSLQPATRAYALLLSAEVARRAGQLGDARDRFELVRTAPGAPALASYAALRLAQMEFDAREFAQAKAGAQKLLSGPLSAELRAAALVLAGEAAYWSGDYEQAIGLYNWFLTDLPGHPQSSQVGLALGWAELRRGRSDPARQRFTAFARDAAGDPNAAAALMLAAELAARAGDTAAAQAMLGQVLAKYPQSEHAPAAALNRAVLAIRAGQGKEAVSDLGRLIARGSASPYLGRMRLARGAARLAAGDANDALGDFRAALGQGDDALAHLGLGTVAFVRQRWAEAAREFAEARDSATGPASAAAEYGLAAVNFNQGKIAEFKQFAAGLLARPSDPHVTPLVLHGMEAAAVEEGRWSEARTLSLRLVEQFPSHEAGAQALAHLASAAGRGEQWPLAREMYSQLRERYPGNPVGVEGRLDYDEALLRTGAAAEARRDLEAFVNTSPGDARLPRAMLLLAEAQEASGDRAGALDVYGRFARDFPSAKETPWALLGEGRVLQTEGKWGEARGFLERALNNGDARVVSQAAYQLGEGLRQAGRHADAVEMYMTAAYAAPESSWARRALVGAGQSFTALKQPDSAAIVYKKALTSGPSGQIEPEVADAARRGLKALGFN
jgi:TolA-binding protein